jgi:hypothetical protein
MKKSTLIVVSVVSALAGVFGHKTLMSNSPAVPIATNNHISPAEAHYYSATYRYNAGICNTPGRENMFELTEQTVDGLADAIDEIKELTGGTLSSKYRCIFGQDESKQTFLMVVALDKSGYEYQSSDYMSKITGGLPCPTFCDINKSVIISGDAAKGQSACK